MKITLKAGNQGTPKFVSWVATYTSTNNPTFTFDVLVPSDEIALGTVSSTLNVINISTDTPETDYTNNDDSHEHFFDA